MNRMIREIINNMGEQCTLEVLSLRNALVYFGFKVDPRYGGRANDFIKSGPSMNEWNAIFIII